MRLIGIHDAQRRAHRIDQEFRVRRCAHRQIDKRPRLPVEGQVDRCDRIAVEVQFSDVRDNAHNRTSFGAKPQMPSHRILTAEVLPGKGPIHQNAAAGSGIRGLQVAARPKPMPIVCRKYGVTERQSASALSPNSGWPSMLIVTLSSMLNDSGSELVAPAISTAGNVSRRFIRRVTKAACWAGSA